MSDSNKAANQLNEYNEKYKVKYRSIRIVLIEILQLKMSNKRTRKRR